MLVFDLYLDFFDVFDLIGTLGDTLVVFCAVGSGLVFAFWSLMSPAVEVDLVVEENLSRRQRFPEGLSAMFSNCKSRLILVLIPSEKKNQCNFYIRAHLVQIVK